VRPLNLLPPRFEIPNVLGDLQESVLFEMTDKSLCVELVIASLLEHNLNQQISHFRSFNSTRKANLKVLVHIRSNLSQPYQMSGSWAFLSLQFH